MKAVCTWGAIVCCWHKLIFNLDFSLSDFRPFLVNETVSVSVSFDHQSILHTILHNYIIDNTVPK